MRFLLVILPLFLSTMSHGQSPYGQFQRVVNKLKHAADREVIYDSLRRAEAIPFVVGDSVAFLYKGDAKTVRWTGDFNGWEYDKTYPNIGTKIPGSNIWILKAQFPRDARLDYKLLVDDQWILDPDNPKQQLSGVGGGSLNSELRMPDWKPDPVTISNPSTPRGKLDEDIVLKSTTLGYQITYSLYLPHGYDMKTNYPVLYVTDGYEYIHPQMGNIRTVLDNLIGSGRIQPLIVVLVDHRDPVNRSQNRRMTELAMNSNYLQFFVSELIPSVEKKLALDVKASERGILGTSMGALTSAFFAFSRPDVFGLAGIQSPAFWFRPEIYTFCDDAGNPPVKLYMTTGVINDAREGVEKMKSIFEKNTCTFQYKEVSQGHSWGQWKDLVDDILIYFYPGK